MNRHSKFILAFFLSSIIGFALWRFSKLIAGSFEPFGAVYFDTLIAMGVLARLASSNWIQAAGLVVPGLIAGQGLFFVLDARLSNQLGKGTAVAFGSSLIAIVGFPLGAKLFRLKNSQFLPMRFLKTFGVAVALPALMLLFPVLGPIGLALLWLYFVPPVAIFGTAHFQVGIGVIPKDVFGYGLTFLLYTVIAALISFSDRPKAESPHAETLANPLSH